MLTDNDLKSPRDNTGMDYATLVERTVHCQFPEISLDGRLEIVPDREMLQAVAHVFFFFGLAFRYPDQPLYREVQQHIGSFRDMYTEYAGRLPDMPGMTDLQNDFIQLFVNSKETVPAVPYASYYLDNNLLMGLSYERLKNLMHASGYALHSAATEPQDHISFLLELCSNLVHALMHPPAGDQPPGALFKLIVLTEEFMAPWIETWTFNIRSCAWTEFYALTGLALNNVF